MDCTLSLLVRFSVCLATFILLSVVLLNKSFIVWSKGGIPKNMLLEPSLLRSARMPASYCHECPRTRFQRWMSVYEVQAASNAVKNPNTSWHLGRISRLRRRVNWRPSPPAAKFRHPSHWKDTTHFCLLSSLTHQSIRHTAFRLRYPSFWN